MKCPHCNSDNTHFNKKKNVNECEDCEKEFNIDAETSEQSTPLPTKIFISYARGDDEAFAKRLYQDLTARGFEVWWDRESLHSVQLTFHQQIKDAIVKEIDRLIYIAGPKAAISEYVREEWKCALECDKHVIPILRLGDYSNLPGELCMLHCDDFRDDALYDKQFEKLVETLNQPAPPVGKLFAVPNLPSHFLGRPELMRRLKDAVLIDLQKPVVVTSAGSQVGVQGMGGIGKSVLAAAVARDREVRRSYPDGIIWISFGQHPDVLQLMRDLATHLGDKGTFQSIEQAKGTLRNLLLDKAALLVFDDVWNAADAAVFNLLGPRCRALVTTRDAGILHTLGGTLLPVELFTKEEAIKLLADSVEQTPEQLPQAAKEIVEECGRLPLAVALCGGMAKKSSGGWDGILYRLQHADLEKIEDRQSINEQHINIWRAMHISVEILTPEEQQRFSELSVFITDQTIPQATVETLWAHTGNMNEYDTEDLIINLNERSLIRLDKNTLPDGKKDWRISLHDLLYDYAIKVTKEPQTLQQNLLDAYEKKCSDGWHTGPNDGYFLQNLCYHFLMLNKLDDAVQLLTNLLWIEACCVAGLVFKIQNDYKDVKNALPEAQPEIEEERRREERINRYTREIIEYSSKWNERHDKKRRGEPITEPEPVLPEPPPTVSLWTHEEIEADTKRIIENPTLLDKLKAFESFVKTETYPLNNYSYMPGFVIQLAFNFAPAGPIHEHANKIAGKSILPMILRQWKKYNKYNPHQSLLSLLEGHTHGVSSLSITPDGKRVVSGSEDKTLRVWEIESSECLRTLEGHTDTVSSVSITPDGKRAVSGSWDKTLRVWDIESGECLRTLEGHTDDVSSLSITPDGKRAVSGSWDKTLRVWDIEIGECLRTLEGHTGTVSSVSIIPDGKRAVSGSWDKSLRVWEIESGECLRTLEGHTRGVSSVSITPDGKRAVSGSFDRTLRVWEIESSECLRTIERHTDGVFSISITPDGKRAVSGSWDKSLRVWEIESGECLRTLERYTDDVSSLSITPDGKRAVWGSLDKTLRVWDIESGECVRTLEGHTDGVSSVSITPDGKRAISGSLDKTLRVWDMESGGCFRTLEGHTDCVWSISITPNGKRAVSGSWDKTLRVWDIESGECLRTLEGHTDSVWSISITPYGKRAVSGSSDWTLRVWEIESGECLINLEGHNSSVYRLNITHDGKRAVSGSSDRTLRVWDLESGVCQLILSQEFLSIAIKQSELQTIICVGTAIGDVLFYEIKNFE
ncbi:MAG: NB-ARC domain-containing protein [bacterium]